MKLFSTFAVFAILAFTSKAKADWMADSKACLAEVNATPEELQKFFKGGMNPADATDNVKCHMKCMYEKKGFFKDGVFDDQAFIKGLDSMPKLKDRAAEIAKLAATCKAEKGANPCDTAFKVSMCFKKSQDALGLSPN